MTTIGVTIDRRRASRRGSGQDSLTPFETRILTLLATGASRYEIAAGVGRSPQTISNALTAAKQKLGARTLTHAAVLTTRRQLTERRNSGNGYLA